MYLAVMDGSLNGVEPVDHKSQPVSNVSTTSGAFTVLQGQYLAFIHAYTKVNRRPPAQADLQRHFGVTPPTVHQMVLTLERLALLRRTPGQARSLEVLYGKVMELRGRGLSAFMLCGSYRLPPVTLTGDVARDLMFIEPLIGATISRSGSVR